MCASRFASSIRGRNACTPWRTPKKFTSRVQRQLLSGSFQTGAPGGRMPALLHSSSAAPNSWVSPRRQHVRDPPVWRHPRVRKDHLRARAGAARPQIEKRGSGSMSASARRMPSAAKRCAMALPMPWAAPVTTATLFWKFCTRLSLNKDARRGADDRYLDSRKHAVREQNAFAVGVRDLGWQAEANERSPFKTFKPRLPSRTARSPRSGISSPAPFNPLKSALPARTAVICARPSAGCYHYREQRVFAIRCRSGRLVPRRFSEIDLLYRRLPPQSPRCVGVLTIVDILSLPSLRAQANRTIIQTTPIRTSVRSIGSPSRLAASSPVSRSQGCWKTR